MDRDPPSKNVQVSRIARQIFAERCSKMHELEMYRDWFISAEERAELIQHEKEDRRYPRGNYHNSYLPGNMSGSSFDVDYGYDDGMYEEREKISLGELGKIVDKEIELSYFLAKRFVDRRLKILK